jgi:hypothetical protein
MYYVGDSGILWDPYMYYPSEPPSSVMTISGGRLLWPVIVDDGANVIHYDPA